MCPDKSFCRLQFSVRSPAVSPPSEQVCEGSSVRPKSRSSPQGAGVQLIHGKLSEASSMRCVIGNNHTPETFLLSLSLPAVKDVQFSCHQMMFACPAFPCPDGGPTRRTCNNLLQSSRISGPSESGLGPGTLWLSSQ
ncbi:hypothetical protein KUCAC02_008932, partial [Chaenocephalus aceratus]